MPELHYKILHIYNLISDCKSIYTQLSGFTSMFTTKQHIQLTMSAPNVSVIFLYIHGHLPVTPLITELMNYISTAEYSMKTGTYIVKKKIVLQKYLETDECHNEEHSVWKLTCKQTDPVL